MTTLKSRQISEDKQRNKNNAEPRINTAPKLTNQTNQIVWMIKTTTNKKTRQRLWENSQEFPHLFLGAY